MESFTCEDFDTLDAVIQVIEGFAAVINVSAMNLRLSKDQVWESEKWGIKKQATYALFCAMEFFVLRDM